MAVLKSFLNGRTLMVKRSWLQLLRQDQGRPSRDSEGLHVKPIFGHQRC